MKSLLRPLITSVLALVVAGAMGADVIIESRSGGKNHDGYKETAGSWLDSNTPPQTAKSGAPGLTPQGQIGSRKTTIIPNPSGNKETVVSAARFTPKIETAGEYNVYVTFSRAANAMPVTYVIKHASGEEKKDINQDGWGALAGSNANKWVELGRYSFAPGADQYVEMQVTEATKAADPGNPASAFTDAVRFSTEPVATAAAPQPAAPAAPDESEPATPATSAATPAGEIQWLESLTTGRAEGKKQDKKLFVFFFSPQSSRSTEYEKRVINDPKVKGLVNEDFVAVKINMDVERELTAQLQVFRAGTINVYDSATGNGLEHISNTPEADELIKRLNAVK